ncbi:MAG: hypothetical protein II248_04020 [Paludibacteraceae bacterium]|nr:hypothetical protein [Paludibacteraceae bacterium]
MKQFLRHIFLLLALFMATTSAWAECYVISDRDMDLPYESRNANETGTSKYVDFSNGYIVSFKYRIDEWAGGEHTLIVEGWNGSNWVQLLNENIQYQTSDKSFSANVEKYTQLKFTRKAYKGLTAIDAGKKTIVISDIYISREITMAASVNPTEFSPTLIGEESESGQITVDYSNIGVTQVVSSTNTTDFTITPKQNNFESCVGTASYDVVFHPKGENGGVRSTTITIAGREQNSDKDKKYITITLTGVALGVPVHSWLGTTEYYVDDVIDLSELTTTTNLDPSTPRVFSIIGFETDDNFGSEDPHFIDAAKTKVKLSKEGRISLQMSQAATDTYLAQTSQITLTIKKHDLKAFIVQSTAVWNEIIDNPFSLSYGLIDFDVESKNTNIAEYHKDTKEIQTYFTNGTASFQITRPEDYKYNALSKTLTLDVNQSTVNCPVLEDSKQRDWETINNSGIYEIPSGAPDSLFFQARRTDILGFTNTTEFFAEYSSDNNTWSEAMKIDLPEQGTWYDLKCDIPETAKYVRFITYTGATGNKHIRNVQVTRKAYLRPSTKELTLPQTNIGKSSEKTFDLSWSTCSDDIKLVSNNDLFEVGTTQINTTAHTGTTNNILVRFKGANEPGTYSAVITIYDQSQSKEVHVSCNVKDRLTTKIVYTGESQYSEAHDCIKGLFSVIDDETGNTITGANIVLTSSNNDILEICDNAGFMPHCGGQVTLAARFEGDKTYAPAEWSREITVANCYQTIDWEQDFRQFIAAEDGTISQRIELTAKADPTDFAITYELDEAAQKFASLENQDGKWFLVIFGVGTGHIIANAPSGTYETKYYDAASLMHEIRVRKWGDKCNTDESVASDEITLSALFSWFYDDEEVIGLDGRPYERMEFYSHVSSGSGKNELTVSFSADGGATWSNSQTYTIPETYDWNTPYIHANVPEGANQVKFKTTSTGMTYFNMVKMVQKTYLEPNVTEIRIDDAIVNQQFSREFKVKYSDIPLLQHVISDSHDLGLKLTSTPPVANDCGDWGEYTFTLTGESPYPQDVTETITFYTSAGDEVKIPVTITANLSDTYYFNQQAGNWGDLNNWQVKEGATPTKLPTASNPVVITKPMTINEGELVAYGVTIAEGGSVNIQPTGGLTLHAGGFTNVTENNFEVQNNFEGAGYVRVSKYFKKLGGTMPKMKVRFTTKANMKNGGNKDAAWQYIGAPGAETQMQVVNTSTLYLRSEEKGWVRQWDSNASLTPFAGYAFTQKDQPSIDFTPRLVTEDQTITLTYTEGGMEGDNLWANSYMAPIDIKKIGKEDFSGAVDQIVYLYNCGSWNEWNKDQSEISSAEILPGRYYAIPVGSARALDATYDQTVIPPMQGVYMVANDGGGSLTLNYEKHVWNCESNEMNRALRIAGKHSSEEDYLNSILRIRLQVNSQNSGADRMYLIQDSTCTADYDNGFDAPKQMTEGLLNLYTNEACGKMEISATDNIDGMYLGFVAGDDEVYTMTFTSLIGEDLYLYDVEQDTLVGMANGETYEFAAAAKSTNDMRFQILVNPDLSDYQPNTGNGDGVTTDIYDVQTQQFWVQDKKVYIANAPANSLLEVYTVSGVAVAKYAIGYAPCTLDLSDMPTGVYMLRLNDTVYKFVCD